MGYSGFYMADGVSPNPTGLTAGIAIPLKFSNFNKGEINMAEIRVQQAGILFKQAELHIRNEIIQAWEYVSELLQTGRRISIMDCLQDAENVRKGKIYSYQRGETSLLGSA